MSRQVDVYDEDRILFLEDLVLHTRNYGDHIIIPKGEVITMMGIQFRLSREVSAEDRENRFGQAKVYVVGNWVHSLDVGHYNTAYIHETQGAKTDPNKCMMLPLDQMPKYLNEKEYHEWAVIAKARLQDLL